MSRASGHPLPPRQPGDPVAALKDLVVWAIGQDTSAGDSEKARKEEKVLRARARSTARVRAWVVGGFVAAGYVALAVRAGMLMLGSDDRLQEKARVQFQQPVVLEARRGEILDRTGGRLATSVPMPTLHVDPSKLAPSDARTLARSLAPLLEQPAEALEKRLMRPGARNVLLDREIHPAVARKAVALAAPGVLWVEDENRRYYPGGAMAAQLLGVVGRNGRGLGGLELTVDRYLRGDTFKFVELRDRKGRGIRPAAAALQAAHRGDTVITTLDPYIQLAAERAIDHIMEASVPEAANMVVLDVRTGEILALVNRPSGNPNNTQDLDHEKLKNRAVMDSVEPGSVFKPFVMALALEDGLIEADDRIDCENGAWTLGRKTITDTHPHGVLTMTEVIKYSSNIGAAKLALRLGAEKTIAGLRDFGYGRPTELGLPGEVSGILRSATSIKPIELATTAYGQGVTSSTVQLAAGVAALANDGVRMKPHIVKEVRDRRGDVISTDEGWVDRVVVSSDTARTVARMMVTVTEEGGTGTRARVPGYLVAGKTGTAWKVVDGAYSSTARISSFVGFLPADHPEVAIAVVVDTATVGSKYGGIAAAPAFAEVGQAVMQLRGIEPDPSVMTERERKEWDRENADETAPPTDSLAPLRKGFWSPIPLDEERPALSWADATHLRLPDLQGLSMREVFRVVQGTGLELALVGEGKVVSQTPAPDALIAPGERLEIRFQ